jgi:hypothetical protein
LFRGRGEQVANVARLGGEISELEGVARFCGDQTMTGVGQTFVETSAGVSASCGD